jgi:hypothetical protein
MNCELYKSGSVTITTHVYFPFSRNRSHDHRILPDKNAFHPFLLHFSVVRMPSSSSSTSISPRRFALSTIGHQSFARAECRPLSNEEIKQFCLVVVGNKADLAPSSTRSAVSEGAALDFINEFVPLSASPSSSLATLEDERNWVLAHRVSLGSDDEVVAHDNGSIESSP